MIRYFDRHALDTLQKGRLRVSEPTRFNDPYEFLLNYEASELPDDLLRRVIDHNVRIVCGSDPRRLDAHGDILMWSHYSRSHSGFRIHFDDRFLLARCEEKIEVEYESVIPLYPEIGDWSQDVGKHEAFHCFSYALRSKGAFWAYEKEIRYFFTKERCRRDRKHGFHYIPLPAKSVKRVDIGMQTEPVYVRAMTSLLGEPKYQHVAIFQARRAKGQYAIEYVD